MEIKTEHSTNKTQREKSKNRGKEKDARRFAIIDFAIALVHTHKNTQTHTYTHFGKLLAIASSNTQLEENQKAQIFFA